jgi:hypothetical protein
MAKEKPEGLRRVDWTKVVLMASVAAAFAIPVAKHWLG